MQNKRRQYHIAIGGYYASRKPVVIRTLLGSCVAVCLHDPQKKIGGMNHILLPGRAAMKKVNTPAQFAVNSMELLIKKVIRLGGTKNELTAKIFGGGQIMPSIDSSQATGPKIVSFVKELLELQAIELIKENTGGTDTRTIYFHTDTGNVYLKRTPSSMVNKLAAEENNMIPKFIRATGNIARQ